MSAARGVAVDVRVTDVSIGYDAGDVVRDVTFTVPAGESMVLLGPSGCGKTTLLRGIAGLERPRRGSIHFGDRAMSTDGGAWMPPERRAVGMIFQEPALFPHLSVRQNVAFGLRTLPGDEAARRVDEMLGLVDLVDLGDRRPATLSGGQQQRVALARSLAPRPSVLLLDEPFSALDASLRVQLRGDVAAILREVGVTAIFVTHDQDEAFALGDRVGVMRDGAIRQIGTPEELYESQVDRWIAQFVGEANFVVGVGCGEVADTPLGRVPLVEPRHDPVDVLLRPESIAITNGAVAGAVATVERAEYFGHDVRYELRLADGATVVTRAQGEHRHRVGDQVTLTYRGQRAHAWPTPG